MIKGRKTFIVLLIVIAVAICSIIFSGCEEKKDEGFFIVATDVHVVANSLITKENYAKYADEDKLEHLATAIFNSFVDEVIETDAQYVLLCGDLAEYGDVDSHKAVADGLKRLKENGVQPYVINGNHDVPTSVKSIGKKASQKQFKEIYAEYGYNQAIATCEGTLSYVANLGDKFRLIAIDDISYYVDEEGTTYKESISDEHKLWIYDQIDACKNDGRQAIVITHIPFLGHLPNLATIIDDEEDEMRYKEITDYMAKKGVGYIFAGHEHLTDITQKTVSTKTKEYNLYEIMTGSMVYVDNNYREVKFKDDEVEIETKSVKNISKDEYYSEYVTQDIKDYIKDKGLTAYTENHVKIDVYDTIKNIASDGGRLDISVPTTIEPLFDLLKTEVVSKLVVMPYYEKDEKDGEVSLEKILDEYEVEMPNTEFKNLADLASTAVIRIARGDEEYSKEELDLIKYTLYWIVDYISEINDEVEEIYPEYPIVSLNKQELYTLGKLECYDSNVMPFITSFASDFIVDLLDEGTLRDTAKNLVENALKENMDIIRNTLITNIVNGMTDNLIVGFENYFYSKYIDLKGFIEEGLYKDYISDFVSDAGPDDKSYEIKYSDIEKDKTQLNEVK